MSGVFFPRLYDGDAEAEGQVKMGFSMYLKLPAGS
jgi:hypothetical protein